MPIEEFYVSLPFSTYKLLCREFNASDHSQRFGQFAHNYLQLHKFGNPANIRWADRLFTVSSNEAEKMLLQIIDYEN